jgi:hypothetical protein
VRFRSGEFRKFRHAIGRAAPRELDVHLVLGNYQIHKRSVIRNRLVKRPRSHLYFTPTSASWVNPGEHSIAAPTEKQLRRGVHRSIREVELAIERFISSTDDAPKRFVWTKTVDQILDIVARFRGRTSDPKH